MTAVLDRRQSILDEQVDRERTVADLLWAAAPLVAEASSTSLYRALAGSIGPDDSHQLTGDAAAAISAYLHAQRLVPAHVGAIRHWCDAPERIADEIAAVLREVADNHPDGGNA